MNDLIKKERKSFISNLEIKSRKEQKNCHYNSVLNLTDGLLTQKDEDANKFKTLLLEFYDQLKGLQYNLTDKNLSLELYKEYLSPIGDYLIRKKEFRTRMDKFKYVLLGFICDLIMYIFLLRLFVPLFSVGLGFIGFLKEDNKKKDNKFFSLWW